MTQLTNRTFPMLKVFADQGAHYYMSVPQAQAYDQRPFGSMLRHGWIAYSRGHGFYITRLGREAWEEFRYTEIQRKNPLAPLTSYFAAKNYGVDFSRRRLKVVSAA